MITALWLRWWMGQGGGGAGATPPATAKTIKEGSTNSSEIRGHYEKAGGIRLSQTSAPESRYIIESMRRRPCRAAAVMPRRMAGLFIHECATVEMASLTGSTPAERLLHKQSDGTSPTSPTTAGMRKAMLRNGRRGRRRLLTTKRRCDRGIYGRVRGNVRITTMRRPFTAL